MEIKITLNTEHAEDKKAFYAIAEALCPKKKLSFEEFQNFARENGFEVEEETEESASPTPVAEQAQEAKEEKAEESQAAPEKEEAPATGETGAMTPGEFRTELNALRDRLGISTGTPLAGQLAEYIRTVCEQQFGQPLPSKLQPADLYKFVMKEVRPLSFDSVSGQFVTNVPF